MPLNRDGSLSFCRCRVQSKRGRISRMEHWQRIADNLRNARFSWGCSSESDSTGRVLFTADAYAPDGRRFTVLADDSAFFGTICGNANNPATLDTIPNQQISLKVADTGQTIPITDLKICENNPTTLHWHFRI
jgi:hypothetical protein